MSRGPISSLTLFPPPYTEFIPLGTDEAFPRKPAVLYGVALVWNLAFGFTRDDLDRVANRPGGLPLMLLLPQARDIRKLRRDVLGVIEEARPHTVLPYLPKPDPTEMAWLLKDQPDSISAELMDYLTWRGLVLDRETRRIVRRTIELASELQTLAALARGVYMSRRALGRRFQQRGLPVPSHWLQFCRLLHGMIRLQNSEDTLFEVSRSLGYPDGFTFSNQMERLVGVRPSVARERLGWEWFTEAWLRQEWMTGGLQVQLSGFPPRDGGREVA